MDDRLKTVEEMKHSVKVRACRSCTFRHGLILAQRQLHKQRALLGQIDQHMTQYIQLTTEIETAIR